MPTWPNIHLVRQHEPLGLGHAVGTARHHVGDQAFATLLPDDVMVDDGELLRRMVAIHEEHGGVVLALLRVTPDEILPMARRRSPRSARA